MTLHAAIMADIERDETVAELRAEIKRLTDLLEGRPNETTAYRLRAALPISTQQAWLLANLYGLGGDVLTLARATAGMPRREPEDECTGNGVAVQLSRLRKALPNRDMIRTIRGAGFALTPEAIGWINRLLD